MLTVKLLQSFIGYIICAFYLRVPFIGVPYSVPHGIPVPYEPILLYMFRGDVTLLLGTLEVMESVL